VTHVPYDMAVRSCELKLHAWLVRSGVRVGLTSEARVYVRSVRMAHDQDGGLGTASRVCGSGRCGQALVGVPVNASLRQLAAVPALGLVLGCLQAGLALRQL